MSVRSHSVLAVLFRRATIVGTESSGEVSNSFYLAHLERYKLIQSSRKDLETKNILLLLSHALPSCPDSSRSDQVSFSNYLRAKTREHPG